MRLGLGSLLHLWYLMDIFGKFRKLHIFVRDIALIITAELQFISWLVSSTLADQSIMNFALLQQSQTPRS